MLLDRMLAAAVQSRTCSAIEIGALRALALAARSDHAIAVDLHRGRRASPASRPDPRHSTPGRTSGTVV